MPKFIATSILCAALACAAGCTKGSRSSAGTPAGGPPPPPPATPAITAVAPVSGPVAGGTAITLTGSNFVNGATVTIGGAAATGVTVASATSLTATTPAGTAGPATVVVTNPGGLSGSALNAFTYTSGSAPAPTVTAVAPAVGPLAGGTTVTVTGTGFQSGAAVTVGGNPATNVVVATGGTITCTTPAGSAGPAAVVVTNPDTQFASLTGFAYVTIQTQLLTAQSDWTQQSADQLDLLAAPGDVRLRSGPSAWAGRVLQVNRVVYDHGDPTGQRLLVCTGDLGAFLTTDGGQTWTVFNILSTPALPTNAVLSAAFFAGDGTGRRFLLGTTAGALLTTDGGTTFRRFHTGSTPALPADTVSAVAFFDGDTTGNRFLIGCRAQAVNAPGGACWTTNGGNAFTLFDAAAVSGMGGNLIVDVDYFAGDTSGQTFLMASRSDNTGTWPGGVFVTQNGGSSFTRYGAGTTPALPGNQVTSAAFFQGGTTPAAWIAGFDTQWGGTGGLAFTTNGGTSFTTLNTGSTPALPVNDVQVVGFGPTTNHFLAGTTGGAVFTTNGGGALTTLNTASSPALNANPVRGVAWHRGSTADFSIADGDLPQVTTDGGVTLTTLALGAPSLLPGAGVRSVAVFNGDGTGRRILVGTTGGTALSTDGGTSWQWITTATNPNLPSDVVTAVAWYEGNTTGTHFIIGTTGGAAVTTDGGATFTTYTTANGLPNASVNAVDYFSGGTNTTTWLIGTGGGVAYTTDGTNFTVRSATTTPALGANSVTCVAFFNGDATGATWLAGTYGGGLSHTTDGGATTGNWTTWSLGTSPALPGQYVDCCDFFDGNTTGAVFGAGVSYLAPIPHSFITGKGMVRTVDGGKTFQQIGTAQGIPGDLVLGLSFHQGGTGARFAVAARGLGSAAPGGVGFTTDGGTTFTALTTTTAPSLPADTAWRIDLDDSVTAGDRFVVATVGSGGIGLNAVALYQPAQAYWPAGTLEVAGIDGRVWNTTGGLDTAADRRIRGVAFDPGDTTGSRFWVAGRYGAARTTDGGQTFTVRTTTSSPALAGHDLRAVAYFAGDTTGKTALLATDQGALLTTDGGATFTVFDTTNGLPSNDVRAVAFHQGQTTPQRMLIGTENGLTSTTNGGATFTTYAQTVVWINIRSVDYFDGDTTGARFAVGTNSGVYHTQDGGATFTRRAPGNQTTTLPGYTVSGIEYFEGDSSGNTWLAGTFGNPGQWGPGGAALTTDNGATFTRLFPTGAADDNRVRAVAFYQGTTSPTSFAIGHTGGVSLTTNGGTSYTNARTGAGLPGNDVYAVSYAQAAGASRLLVGTDDGTALTTNGGGAFSRIGTAPLAYDRLVLGATLPAGTGIAVQVADATGAPLPDSVLNGNAAWIATGPGGAVDLSAIPLATYPAVTLRLRLTTTTPAVTPVLHDLRIRFGY